MGYIFFEFRIISISHKTELFFIQLCELQSIAKYTIVQTINNLNR